MARIREEVEIAAPVARVWTVVHEDLKNVPKWSRNIARVHMLNSDVPGKGSEIRYDVKLPGGRIVALDFEQTTWNPPKRCAGHFLNGPIKGTWAYAYSQRDGTTTLRFEADYELGGMLRFVGGIFSSQYAAGVRDNLKALKIYVEKNPPAASKPTGAAANRGRAKAPAVRRGRRQLS